MGSLTQEYSKEKLMGQIYTPKFIVEKILDDITYNSAKICGRLFLDPACGDGRFLTVVAERIIKYSDSKFMIDNLSKIHGWDIDSMVIDACIENLNAVVEPLNIKIKWNVKVKNSL